MYIVSSRLFIDVKNLLKYRRNKGENNEEYEKRELVKE